MGVLVALGALVAAVWAGHTSKRLYEIETTRDRSTEEREEREQASGIAAWCIYAKDLEEGLRHGIFIHNSSGSPVYDVSVRSIYAKKKTDDAREQPPMNLAVLPPGDYVVTAHAMYNWTFPEERHTVEHSVRPVTNSEKWMVVSLQFTDAYGIRWTRENSRLTRTDESSSDRASSSAVSATGDHR